MEKLTVNNVYANFLNSRTENSFANYLDIITAPQFSCYISLKNGYRYLAFIMSSPPLYNIKYAFSCLHSVKRMKCPCVVSRFHKLFCFVPLSQVEIIVFQINWTETSVDYSNISYWESELTVNHLIRAKRRGVIWRVTNAFSWNEYYTIW